MLDYINDDIFNVECNLLVIPVSTEGTISKSFRAGLNKLQLSDDWEGKPYNLGDVEIRVLDRKGSRKYIAFACSVEEYNSAYFAIRMIGRKLARIIQGMDDVKEIATPILGTGAGRLDPFLSRNIMVNAFYEVARPSVRLIFCTRDLSVYRSFENRSLDIDIASGLLVLKAELPNIAENDLLRDIQSEKEYYFDLAEQKFKQYLDYEPKAESFYKKLEDDFKFSRLTFKDFLAELSNRKGYAQQSSFANLCGELIAYMDYHAYRKNIWNKYSDKRVLAKSAVRQQHWFTNLIRFKRTGHLHELSSSISNAIIYLMDPAHNITMLSERQRASVFSEILSQQYTSENGTAALLAVFRELGLRCRNPKNFGFLCSRILYLPFIKQIWTDPAHQGKDEGIVEEQVDISQAIQLIENCLVTQSTSLDLGNCGLTDLSILPELFECIHLEELILSNEWAVYENGKWKKITSRNKGKRNTLKELPSEINKLKYLKRLICGGDWNSGRSKWNRWEITNLSPITSLPELEYLNLSNNRIKNTRGLSKLHKLASLHLNNNEISSVESLSGLNNLAEILLSNNFIQNVSFLQGLEVVYTIDLHQNSITDLRPIQQLISRLGIVNDKWKVGTINVAKNSLEQPPMEIVNIGKEAVLRTLEDIKRRGSYINKDIKVVLVGNSEAGKSTLVKYLDNGNGLDQTHPATLWMEEKVITSKYKINKLGDCCILHIFDFGGHDYYHDTHHLFYSTNTVYLLVWEERTNNLNLRKCIQEDITGEKIEIETQDYPVKYWLESVKYYIKDIKADNFEFDIERETTYSGSLLLAQNKVPDASRITHLNNQSLSKNYSFIHEIINISIKDPERNMVHFDVIFEEMLDKMDIVGAVLPKYYEIVKNSIVGYSGQPVLGVHEFQQYCSSLLADPIDTEQCRILINYLQQIGMLLYSENSGLGKVYVQKKWVIDNIHKVLLNLSNQAGEFDKKYMEGVLGGSSDDDINNVLEMMLDFRMIFRHPYKECYIAPLYLSRMPEAKVKLFLNERTKPYRRFEYSGFIQKHVVLSIFQNYSNLISGDRNASGNETFYYWKDGLIIKKPGTSEIVMIKFFLGTVDGNAYVDVYDVSNHGKGSAFIQEVTQYVREVNVGYELEEMVTLNGIDFISVAVLEKNALHGKLVFSERKLADFDHIKGEEKLFKLKDYEEYMTLAIKRKKVVISYSKKDLAHIHTLRRYLQPLVDAELIEEPWYCTNLLPGDNWNQRIKEKFDEADIVFFMVSEYFYSTRYIVDHEIRNAIDRYDEGDPIKIVPIILEFYDWGRKEPYNLKRFSALPYQAKPISDFGNPKIAWVTITESVKMMIEKDLDPAKMEIIGRDLQEIYERQVKGKLDNNFT
ncbi:COR domain-containing protein [Chitinophaga sp. CC14]|uniref:leucine-rich repeat domain-containing protein n=1 Tax=Chitinophaga sp. CC14 TaxID=3029199 RepID=UPI003B812CB3